MHERFVYTFLRMGEDLGGIMEIIMFVVAFLVLPISEFNFNLAAATDLFYVRTGDHLI